MLTARQRLGRLRERRHARRGLDAEDDDPAAGLINLFDLWMVFAVGVLLTALGSSQAALQTFPSQARALSEPMRSTGRALDGTGERLGTAYRLASGAVVYVPDEDADADADAAAAGAADASGDGGR